MELENAIKELKVKGDIDSLARAEELKNELTLLESDYKFQKKYGTKVKMTGSCKNTNLKILMMSNFN